MLLFTHILQWNVTDNYDLSIFQLIIFQLFSKRPRTSFPLTTTTTTVFRPFVWNYPGEPVAEETFTYTYPDHQSSFIRFLHLLWSIAFSLFSLRAWQSYCTTSVQVLFGLAPSISYSIHFFTHSLSSFCFPLNKSLYTAVPMKDFLAHWRLASPRT